MSMKGLVEVQCPNGCAPFETEVWTMIRFDQNPELRESLLAGQLNLLSCKTCGRHFYYEDTLVIHDPAAELMAFVFPEGYRGAAEKWRAKMESDFAKLEAGLGKAALDYPPSMFFGVEELRHLIDQEANLQDEVDIANHLIRSIGLEAYPVKPSVARARNIPPILPAAPDGGELRARLVAGLKRLLAENAYLSHYKDYLALLESKASEEVPPRAAGR